MVGEAEMKSLFLFFQYQFSKLLLETERRIQGLGNSYRYLETPKGRKCRTQTSIYNLYRIRLEEDIL